MLNLSEDRPRKPKRGKREQVVAGLVNFVPNQFDRFLARAGKWQLFGLMALLAILSIPFMVTSLALEHQVIVAVLLIALARIVVLVEQKQTEGRTSEYLHLFLVWLS
jgi:cellulose synthase (UDP-forming)